MFNIQPGAGLGFTGSRQIAFGLGLVFEVVIVIPEGPIIRRTDLKVEVDIVELRMSPNRVVVRLTGR